MATISLCMIVKNEEETLGRCLDSIASYVDEIIIVDTGSTDKTEEIAHRYTERVYHYDWIEDFSAARNYSFSKATQDYIMWLDADDIIDEENLQKFITLKTHLNGKLKQVAAKYNVAFDQTGNPTLTYYRERIFLRSANYQWVGAIHEVIALTPDTYYSDFAVTHRKVRPSAKDRNLKIFENLIKKNIPLDGRQKFYYARELYYNGRLKDSAEMFEKVIADPNVWKENRISACLDLQKCYNSMQMPELGTLALLKSLTFSEPRAEICCELGQVFLDAKQYKLAKFWFSTALKNKPDYKSGGFIYADYYGYIPALNLCVTYDRMGNKKRAEYYNKLAGKYKPNDAVVESNAQYFKKHFLPSN